MEMEIEIGMVIRDLVLVIEINGTKYNICAILQVRIGVIIMGR